MAHLPHFFPLYGYLFTLFSLSRLDAVCFRISSSWPPPASGSPLLFFIAFAAFPDSRFPVFYLVKNFFVLRSGVSPPLRPVFTELACRDFLAFRRLICFFPHVRSPLCPSLTAALGSKTPLCSLVFFSVRFRIDSSISC